MAKLRRTEDVANAISTLVILLEASSKEADPLSNWEMSLIC